MPKVLDRRPAVEGEVFVIKDRYYARALIGADEGSCEVKAKSPGDKGQWICISCCVPLENQIDKDNHCHTTRRGKSHLVGTPPPGTPDAKHVLAWRSFESGNVEVP